MTHRIRSLVTAATALVTLLVVSTTSASAGTVGAIKPGESSYDRPSIVNIGSNLEEIAWAGTDANGTINYAQIDSSGQIQGNPTTYGGSSTYPGTGVAINQVNSLYAPTLNHVVIAWTDLGSVVHVGVIGNGVQCESTGFPHSIDTPYLTFAPSGSAPGDGVSLYLVTVDSGNAMHVTEVQNNGCDNLDVGIIGGPGTLTAGASTTISGQTTWDGPTLLDTTPNSGPTLWLAWAGTDSAHSINIGSFTFGASSTSIGTHIVERDHQTKTDLGNSYGSRGTLLTYCGTNNMVYGQVFNGGTTEPPEVSLGGNCAIYTSGGYVNGGVDITYDSGAGGYLYLYPTVSSQGLWLGKY